ncbi:MAG: efflux RND transporter permease subunit [Planctomycetes bacterium]|nr:efflux RND transporter permease subunit [Planctomycetota bacterium]
MTDSQQPASSDADNRRSLLASVIYFCLTNKLVVSLAAIAIVLWGAMVAPFDWDLGPLPRDPVPTDAIPDIGENQQIVFTTWTGRSPQDVDDQITYPLTVALLGVPGVKTVRSSSLFGFSSIYVIFEEDVEFYWSRTRVLEKLNSLPAGTLPEGVQPALGPDATPLGQIFWYTLEGRDPDGNPAGGWDLHELRTVQDWYVRDQLLVADGISEVASVGGFVQEYQIDVDPDAMRAARVGLDEIIMAVQMSNIEVGARTIEINKAEYFIRGLGFIETISDIEETVVAQNDNVPITIKDVANVTMGPALRRGALDKGGAEAVGGVVVVRYGFNPLKAIQSVKQKIAEIAPGMPTKAVIRYAATSRSDVELYAKEHGFQASAGVALDHDAWVKHLRSTHRDQWPDWVTTSQVTVVPFYDRSGLIYETLGTLHTALSEEILVTIIVILVSVLHLRSSLLISSLLPLAVLMCFIAMKLFDVEANIVALSGIAIAIGTMVDMGIILCENILRHLEEASPEEDRRDVIFRASNEVGGAVLTAVATTIIGFLPVFTMVGMEGKLFTPLAFTKTFALLASVIVALAMIPPAAHFLFTANIRWDWLRRALFIGLIFGGLVVGMSLAWWAGAIVVALGAYHLAEERMPAGVRRFTPWIATSAAAVLVGLLLTEHWLPLGPEQGMFKNVLFVGGLIGGLLLFFQVFERVLYAPILRWCLNHKKLFLVAPTLIVLAGGSVWLGFDTMFGAIPWSVERVGVGADTIRQSRPWQAASAAFPGLGKEFMPPLDEGSYLYMPSTMSHASIGEVLEVLQLQDRRIMSIPEVELAVGKLGRADSPLDPAPVSMIETVINYHPEYVIDRNGHRLRFRMDQNKTDLFRSLDGEPVSALDGQPYVVQGRYKRDEQDNLIPDDKGAPFRLWRPALEENLNDGRTAWRGIQKPDDIWDEIVVAAQVPGTTSAPRLQPIAARLVMLQSGMRAPMGIKIKGPDLLTIERTALEMEVLLKQVPSVQASAVFAERIVGKPYLEIDFDRRKLARYGLSIRAVQDVVEVAIGGRRVTTTVEGRERYPVRVRYLRELRNQIESLGDILVPAQDGTHIPLNQVAQIKYVRGPQAVKSEDARLIGYVLFDKKPDFAEIDVVEDCQRFLQEKIEAGEFVLPAGVSYSFAGTYENQVRAQKTLMVVLPLALFLIFLVLYFHFRSVLTTSLVFSGIAVAWAGGFLVIWFYGQPWFLHFSVFGTDMQSLFQIHPINLSVAIWVGFLALFGIASDDGVVIATYLDQSFFRRQITTPEEARAATLEAGQRRCRPCLMTSATTILALIPVLTSTGRGSDIMVPMAIPSFGGMTIEIITMLVVPVLFCAYQEVKFKAGARNAQALTV